MSFARPSRDSLELASLASSSQESAKPSISSPSSSRKLSFSDEDPLSTSNPASIARPNAGHARTYSVSSAFNFATNLFPLSSTAAGYTAIGAPSTAEFDPANALDGGSLEKHKSLTYFSGVSLVVGLIIGSGIFSSPSQVNENAGSPGASLIVWAVAGVLAWTGAASYAELGSAIPLNGGAQVYLSKIFGELAGFLYAWSCVCVLKPGSAAIIAIIFGEYVVRAAIGADALDVSPWINKGVAIAGLVLVTFLNCVSTKVGTRSAEIFLFFKFIALLGVTIIGVVVAITGLSWNGKADEDWKTHGWFEGTSSSVSKWAVALYAGLWAFDGWDNVNYVAGEFTNPSRDLPRVIHTSLPLVIISYIFANIAYFLVLPLSVTSSSTTVAVAFGQKVLGPVGSFLLALGVSASCFGALNATVFTTGRLFYAAGKEGYLPSLFGRLGVGRESAAIRLHHMPTSTKTSIRGRLKNLVADDSVHLFHTPIHSLLLTFSLTAAYVAVGSFRTLITFYGVAGYTFYFLTVLGLIVLRVREPHLDRPYRVWITTPIIFCCYCGPECQKAHWHATHKAQCNSPLLKDSWRPSWESESRIPAFIGPVPSVSFGALKFLFGNVPAFDVLRLADNEGLNYQHDLHVLFAASGDPRNLIKTVASLPSTYHGSLECFMNDKDLDIVARNAIMLLAVIALSPEDAAETIIHLWYSAMIPSRVLERVQVHILPLIQEVCTKIPDTQGGNPLGNTWAFGKASLRLVLKKEQWYRLRSYFEVPKGLSSDHADAIRAAIMLAPERVDQRERQLFSNPARTPPVQNALSQRRTFFQTKDSWPMKDSADPLEGWSESDFGQLLAKKDIYGPLYFYLFDLIEAFCNRIKQSTVNFYLFQVDATKLPALLRTNPGNKIIQFDRIEVSNITDLGYLGPEVTVTTFGPLLKPHAANPRATLITLFLNAVGKTQQHQPMPERMNMMKTAMSLTAKHLPVVLQEFKHSAAFHRFSIAKDMFIDFDVLFNRYMRECDFAGIGRRAGLCVKEKHSVIDPLALRLKKEPGQPGAREEFMRLLASGYTGWERYVEWKRI